MIKDKFLNKTTIEVLAFAIPIVCGIALAVYFFPRNIVSNKKNLNQLDRIEKKLDSLLIQFNKNELNQKKKEDSLTVIKNKSKNE